MGVMNRGVVYALWDYGPQNDDELGFSEGDCMTVLRRDDEVETEWWWARCGDYEGYIPRNLLGVSWPCDSSSNKFFFFKCWFSAFKLVRISPDQTFTIQI